MRILLATTNAGKVTELKYILGELGIEVMGLNDFESTEEIETGSTYAENALLKARYYQRQHGMPTIADDSGLEVEALGGAPGLHSARYAGADASDIDRVARLLREMDVIPPNRRGARFICAAALVWTSGEKVFEEQVPGVILERPRGENGFGYDPVFFYEPLDKTFAELLPSEKADVSHRGRAFRCLAAWLNEAKPLDTPRSNVRIIDYRE